MKSKLLLTLLFINSVSFAGEGIIKGLLKDKVSDEPLPFATIAIANSSTAVNTDIDGNYTFNLNAGTYTLIYSYEGFETFEKQITIAENETQEINIELGFDGTQLDDIVVVANRSKAKESALLLDQQRSVEIKQSIGAQELSRKGVGDVATAVTKTTGVAKQESTGTIFVRGLGDRYNSTLLNGLPLASNDPEKKNINLNLFSTDIVEYISIDKTYLTRNPGDFAGGNIDISSKNYTGDGMFNISIGSNINSNAIGQKNFRALSDRSYFGFSSTSQPANALSSFSFSNSTQLKTKTPFGTSIAINGGKSFNIGTASSLNIFATASFDNGYSFKEGVNRSVQAQNSFTKDLYNKTYEYNTNTTAMLNADYKINDAHTIRYNALFINGSQEKNDEYTGYIRDITDRNDNYESSFLNRQNYKQDRLLVNQLLGTHKINDQIDLNWGAALNNVSAQTPDRQMYTFNKLKNSNSYEFSINSRSDNNRYFEDLIENEIGANVDVSYKFAKNNDDEYNGKLTVGYNLRQKNREFKATQYVFQINSMYNTDINPFALDNFFNQKNFEQGYFETYTFRGSVNTPNALLPQTYNGDLTINAGFANIEYKLSDKLSGSIGARFEKITQKVDWQTQLDSEKNTNILEKNAFLPALSLKYELNDLNNLRFAASKTYTLPQFKERARFIYEDVTEIKVGNPDLYASDDYNVDLKWEYFPKNDEVISAAIFGKYILNPINEIVSASSSNDITYANTGDYGYATGLEIEVRKNLINFGYENTNKITGGLNASIMKTYQKLDNEKVNEENKYLSTSFTHDSSSFTGASDFLMNADVSYIKEWGDNKSISSTLSYAYFSDKLYSIGTEQSGNLVDKAFGLLDFTFKLNVNKNLGIGLNAKNLLDPKIEREQQNLTQDVLVRSYKMGRNFSLSLNYSF